MHPFHDHLVNQLADALRSGVAVVVDPSGAFRLFFEELGGTCKASEAHPDVFEITVDGQPVRKVTWDGSWFAVRAAVEPFFSGDGPPDPPLLVYVPTQAPEPTQDVLMELEKAGVRLPDWDFARQARDCLRTRFTDGDIDGMLGGGSATYEDVVHLLAQRGGTASKLKILLPDTTDLNMLVRWLARDSDDARIADKGATPELFRLVASKTGMVLPETEPLAKARDTFARYVLLGEFRHDLDGEPPASTAAVPRPATEALRDNVLEIAKRFRSQHAPEYVTRARAVEKEFLLAKAGVKPDRLGRIDTFEFEERLLLRWCAALLEQKNYAEALQVVTEREASFWVERADVGHTMPRKEQWELCRRVAQLGLRIAAVRGDQPSGSAGPAEWVERYAATDGWHRMDTAQRELETWRGRVTDDEVVEKAVGVALREHERLLHDTAVRFTTAVARAGWSIPGVLHQTRVYPEVVATRGGPVAWFFVDALRFEMGAELARQLAGAEELHLRPAIAALPSITPVGMAALLPGASANFAVVEHKDKLASLVDGVPLAALPDRQKYLQARVPDVVDLTLSKVLQDKQSELKKRIAGRSLVVVRSTEIDYLGETGDDHLARQAMETVIGNLARAIRRLAGCGVEHFVITADHGHQFGLRKGDDMKIDSPGGDTVELHRRCWIGRGGTTPAGTMRVSASELGYASDLEFVFPVGGGVFKAGGGLSFHHGSTSLQELVIPVLSFRLPTSEPKAVTGGIVVTLEGLPDQITNRMFIVTVKVTGQELFATEPLALRVVLVADQEQVGQAGMATGGELNRETGVVSIKPGATAQIGMALSRDDVASLKVVVHDPASAAVLAMSPVITLNLMR